MKKRIIIISGIVVFCLAVLLIILLFNKGNNSYSKEIQELINTKVDRAELIGITYSKNLGENKIDSIEINIKELRLKKYQSDSDVIFVDEYKITDSDIKGLKSYIDEYNLPAWTNLPVGNIDLVEEDKESIVLIYDNSNVNGQPYDFYVIDINKGTKKEYYDIIVKFKKKIELLMTKENKTISYEERKGVEE